MKKIEMLFISTFIIISCVLVACGQKNTNVSIRYNDKSFYYGDKKSDIDKVLGQPVKEEDYGEYSVCKYIDTLEYVLVEYDKDKKSNIIEVYSKEVSVAGLELDDNCYKVQNMFPKYKFSRDSQYNKKFNIQEENACGEYNIYMNNQQNIDKEVYDNASLQDPYYEVDIICTNRNTSNADFQKIVGFAISK